jgi:hypothetical protein
MLISRGSLKFSRDIPRADVLFDNGSVIVLGNEGGAVNIHAQDIHLTNNSPSFREEYLMDLDRSILRLEIFYSMLPKQLLSIAIVEF